MRSLRYERADYLRPVCYERDFKFDSGANTDGSTYLFNVHVEIHMLVKNDSKFQRILGTSKIS